MARPAVVPLTAASIKANGLRPRPEGVHPCPEALSPSPSQWPRRSAVAVLTAAIWRQASAGPPIETQALGVWQEQTASRPLRVTVSAAPQQAGATSYWVSGADSTSTPFSGRLDGDKIVVQGENAKDVAWIMTLRQGRGRAAHHPARHRRTARPATRLALSPSP